MTKIGSAPRKAKSNTGTATPREDIKKFKATRNGGERQNSSRTKYQRASLRQSEMQAKNDYEDDPRRKGQFGIPVEEWNAIKEKSRGWDQENQRSTDFEREGHGRGCRRR